MLAVLQSVALARYPHWFGWQSPSGMVYLIFLAAFLLTGAAGLTKGLIRTNQGVLIMRPATETVGAGDHAAASYLRHHASATAPGRPGLPARAARRRQA